MKKAKVNRESKDDLDCTLDLCKDNESADCTLRNSNQLDLLSVSIKFTLLEMDCTSSCEDMK